MVRLFTIVILRNDVTPAALLASAQDLSTFGFFQRSSVGEFMTFFAKTVAERTQAGQRQDVEENSTCPPNVFAGKHNGLTRRNRLRRTCLCPDRRFMRSRYIR